MNKRLDLSALTETSEPKDRSGRKKPTKKRTYRKPFEERKPYEQRYQQWTTRISPELKAEFETVKNQTGRSYTKQLEEGMDLYFKWLTEVDTDIADHMTQIETTQGISIMTQLNQAMRQHLQNP